MEQNIKKNGLINLLALLVVGAAGFAVARSANSVAGQVSILFIGLGVLVAAVSWFQMRLEESERLEKLELEELAKGHATAAMFEAKDAEVFPAQRAREQFERFFVPLFTVVLCLMQAGGAYLLWRWLSQPATRAAELTQPMMVLALFGLFFLVLFLLGRFSASFARLENRRLLRPGASYLLLNAFLCLIVALAVVGVQTELPKADLYVAYALCTLLALTGIETLINLVLEVYRPRVKGKIERPLYDSRLVGLLGQPEGLITTAAQALDYQFGFKVSETWFYRLFFERALKWLLLAQAGVLVLSSCFVFIETGEQGLLEHFGNPVTGRTPLGPGAHLKWPWPIDTVYRFGTEQIQSFEIGTAPGAEKEEERIVLWTVKHTKQDEDNFLVANREQSASPAAEGAAKRTPPVSLLTGSIPIQYQITDLLSWAYKNEDASSLLQDLARREIVRYFVSADMNDILSRGRLEAAQRLIDRIQAAADERNLGAKIISVGLQDLHPPVKVAADYEKVVAAIHTKEAKILAARADDVRTNALARAQAVTLVNRASAERTTREIGALAQAALFTNQIPAFEAAPSVYGQRAYLQTFARATADARKYLLLTTNTHDVLTFDLQESFTRDLSRLSIPQPKAK
jgi:regulator of protease activity HflC (stomatin/prohibitin superfamily)